MPFRTGLLAWLPAVAWAALIFWFSAQPDLRFVPDQGLDLVVRKAGHVTVFGILALLVWRALAVTTTLRRPSTWGVVLAVAYAATDEAHQSFVGGRSPSVVDVAIDALGALLAVALVRAWLARRHSARRA